MSVTLALAAVDFTPAPDEAELRSLARRLASARIRESDVRAAIATELGYDADVWHQLSELGFPGLLAPVPWGGLDLTPRACAAVCEEFGGALLGGPLFATALLAVPALRALDAGEFWSERGEGILEGTTVATVAGVTRGRPLELSVSGRGAPRLSGELGDVLEAQAAGLVIVPVRVGRQVRWYAVDAEDAGMSVEPLHTLALTRRFARVTLTDARATDLGEDRDAVLRDVLAVGMTMLAAEQVGGSHALLRMSAEYARTRIQFGRAIGSFQAVKHHCANMLVLATAARSAADYSAWALAEASPSEARVAGLLAHAYCSDAYLDIARTTIQLHGGIGFTWEHPAHLYFRRAKSSQAMFSTPNSCREEIAQFLADRTLAEDS